MRRWLVFVTLPQGLVFSVVSVSVADSGPQFQHCVFIAFLWGTPRDCNRSFREVREGGGEVVFSIRAHISCHCGFREGCGKIGPCPNQIVRV